MTAFTKICRACNSEKLNLLNLFARDCDDEPTLGEKFFTCTALNLDESDVYPQSICYSCAKSLETAYKFRKQCERSHNQFKKKIVSLRKAEESMKVDVKVDAPCEDEEPPMESMYLDEDMGEDEKFEQLGSNEINVQLIAEKTHEDVSTTSDKGIGPEKLAIKTVRPIAEEVHEDVSTTSDKAVVKSHAEPGGAIVDVSISIQDRPQKCLNCNKSFFTLKALELHTRLSHKVRENVTVTAKGPSPKIEDSNSFTCNVCNIQLNSAEAVKMHRILEHGEKTFECNICGKHIRNKITYRKHLLSHNDSRPFTCKVCGKQYTDYRYLYRHMLYHQSVIYKCTEQSCEKTFNVKHKFVEHIRLYHNRNITTEQVRRIHPTEEDDDINDESEMN